MNMPQVHGVTSIKLKRCVGGADYNDIMCFPVQDFRDLQHVASNGLKQLSTLPTLLGPILLSTERRERMPLIAKHLSMVFASIQH